MLQTVTIADGKEIPITAPAAKFSRTPTKIRHRAPTLGEHNAEIMVELGYSAEELQRLVEIGAL
jgi:crotonobetainyl-CoA:carnitine CoA-transferase CaiB-like acyl-CoA transferase